MGTVAVVGAGPGDPNLITLAGARLIARADVVIYDRLAPIELLELARTEAKRISVGKAKGSGPSQGCINQLMVRHAQAGQQVVRLKGGDPAVFGRVVEEIEACGAAGISVTVVPGVSSALAAPMSAGIPLTERGLSAQVTVISGHRASLETYDWSALADPMATVVAESHCAAAIHAAATPAMRIARCTLGELARNGCPFPSPSVLVVGNVARRRPVFSGSSSPSAASWRGPSALEEIEAMQELQYRHPGDRLDDLFGSQLVPEVNDVGRLQRSRAGCD